MPGCLVYGVRVRVVYPAAIQCCVSRDTTGEGCCAREELSSGVQGNRLQLRYPSHSSILLSFSCPTKEVHTNSEVPCPSQRMNQTRPCNQLYRRHGSWPSAHTISRAPIDRLCACVWQLAMGAREPGAYDSPLSPLGGSVLFGSSCCEYAIFGITRCHCRIS
jgi:hypothetical protein